MFGPTRRQTAAALRVWDRAGAGARRITLGDVEAALAELDPGTKPLGVFLLIDRWQQGVEKTARLRAR